MDAAHALPPAIYGLMAEFDDPSAARARRPSGRYEAGYRRIDAFSPYPIEEAWEAIGQHDRAPVADRARRRASPACWPASACRSGCTRSPTRSTSRGKPLNSWPQFVPVTFELTILFAALSAVLGMIVLNGLPQPYHPVFNVPRFEHA